MTIRVPSITYDGEEYLLGDEYTAGSGINITSNQISNTGVTSFNGNTGAVSLTIPSVSSITVTLASASWSNNEITVTATGVTASNTVIVAPDPTDMADYTDGGVYCSSQASNSLTFVCDTAPSNDIDVNVVILG